MDKEQLKYQKSVILEEMYEHRTLAELAIKADSGEDQEREEWENGVFRKDKKG